MTRNKKWTRWIGLLCFQVERKWVENLHWSGDFSGYAFVDGGYLYRIVRRRNRIAKANGGQE